MNIFLAAVTALVSSAALSASAVEPKLVLKARNYYSYGYEGGVTEGVPNGTVEVLIVDFVRGSLFLWKIE